MASKVRSMERALAQKKEREGAPDKPVTITVKLSDLLDSTANGPMSPFAELMRQPLPTRVMFQLSKMTAAMNKEIASYHETRKAICERHGTLKEDKSAYDIDEEKREEFDAAMKELQATEVELTAIPVTLDMLEEAQKKYGERPLSGTTMLALHWLISE